MKRSRCGSVAMAGLRWLLLLVGSAVAQIPVWGAAYNVPGVVGGWDEAVAMARTPDSCVVVTGIVQAQEGAIKYDAIHTIKYRCDSGTVVWERTWSLLSGGSSTQIPAALAVDDSGMIYITGWVYAAATGTDTDLVVLKYRPNGNLAWAVTYNYANFGDAGTALVPDRMGGVYVAGRCRNPFNSDILTIHFDSLGQNLWWHRKNSFNGNDWATAIALSPAGWLYTAAVCWRTPSNSHDYYLMKYDTALAAHTNPNDSPFVWIKVYSGSGAGGYDEPLAVLCDSAENIYLTGTSYEGVTNFDGTTVKYAANGTQLWVHKFDAGRLDEDRVYKLVAGPQGRVYCGGCTSDGNYYNFLFYPLDEVAGVPFVPWFVNRDHLTLDDTVTALAVDKAGYLFVAGAGVEGDRGTTDWLLFKYRPDGTNIWSTDTGNFEAEDVPNAMVLDELGDAYVTGYFENQLGGGQYELSWMTMKYSEKDVGVTSVVLPSDSFRVGARVSPQAWVRSYSAAMLRSIDVTFNTGEWLRSTSVESLLPYDSVLITFNSKLFEPSDIGQHQVVCYTSLSGDADRANDTSRTWFEVIPGWERLANVPRGRKELKDGTALTCFGDSLVYCLKGSGTTEFYKYRVANDSWYTVESIPYIGRDARKRVKAGAQLAVDTSGHIYAFKGGNCPEFWRYYPDSGALGVWQQLDDLPLGTSGKRVKGGSGLVYVPARRALYALKGNNTDEFYYFDVARDTWLPRRSVIPGSRGYKVKDGSAMAYDGANTIYLIKGNSLELYRYKIAQDSWFQLDNIPYSINDPKRRKFKKGAGLVYDEINNRLIASKGGKGRELWEFDIAMDTWRELPETDMIPAPYGTKLPFGGAAMCASKGKVYATKGNKSYEFWRYNADLPFNPRLPGPGPMAAGRDGLVLLNLEAAPNPFGSSTFLRYSLPVASNVRIVLYDVMGRVVRVVTDEWQGSGLHIVPLPATGLARGVYLVRLQAGAEALSFEATRKLTVTR